MTATKDKDKLKELVQELLDLDDKEMISALAVLLGGHVQRLKKKKKGGAA